MDNNILRQIKIDNIPGFFTNEKIMRVLEVAEISTLEDLFYAFKDKNFIKYFGLSLAILKEMSATIKLLRCKYLGENPNINLSYNSSIEEVVDGLGLSLETGYELITMERIDNFIEKLSLMSLKEKKFFLKKNTKFSKSAIEEFVNKLQIINDYAQGKVPRNKELERLEQLRATVNLLSRSSNEEKVINRRK